MEFPRQARFVTEFTAIGKRPTETRAMPYSRQEPSPRYRALIEMYRDMHLRGERFHGIPPMKTFDGRSLGKEAVRIKRLIDLTGARTILDYGSGKGLQYDPKPFAVEGEGEWDSLIDYWDIDEVTCFDPAFPPYSALPSGRYDGVISTDVLEHCPEEDIDWIVREIFSYAERFVYLAIACFPAAKLLPNGENAHCTVRPPEWWRGMLEEAAASARPGLCFEAWLELAEDAVVEDKQIVCLRGGEQIAAR